MLRLPKQLGGGTFPTIVGRGFAAGRGHAAIYIPARIRQQGPGSKNIHAPHHVQRQMSTKALTHLGAYLERCGATWGDEDASQPSTTEAVCGDDAQAPAAEVVVSEDGRCFTWLVNLAPSRLSGLRRGDALESPAFPLGDDRHRGRLQFFPKGDGFGREGFSSLWLWTDNKNVGVVQLRLGSFEKNGGSSEFCKLEDVWCGGTLEAGIRLEPASTDTITGNSDTEQLQQSLQMTGLQAAEWRIFNIKEVMASSSLLSSAPFRFHHVLLGDMYLELLPGESSRDFCTIFFRCRVPTMKMQVHLAVGSSFSKSFVSEGRATVKEDLQHDRCMQVNLDVPGVLESDGVLTVRCTLQQLVSVPRNLQEMMPKLDERALWPKRL